MPTPFDPSYASMLGIDPAEMRRQMIAQALIQGGAGLAGGQNWGQGLSQGLTLAGQGALQARENAITEGVRGFQLKKYQDEEAKAQALAEAAGKMKAPTWADPEIWSLLPSDVKFDIMKEAWTREPEGPLKMGEGDVLLDPVTHQPIYSVPKTYAPQQPQQPSEFHAWREAVKAETGRYPTSKQIADWRRSQSGGITLTQESSNAEIDAARRYLIDNNLTMDEVLRRTQETSSIGRDNPDYDPYLAKTFNLAMSRKTGEDPDFESFQGRYRGGGAQTPQASTPGTSMALPRNPAGQIDAAQLNTTDIYDDGVGGKWRWTGSDFVSVP